MIEFPPDYSWWTYSDNCLPSLLHQAKPIPSYLNLFLGIVLIVNCIVAIILGINYRTANPNLLLWLNIYGSVGLFQSTLFTLREFVFWRIFYIHRRGGIFRCTIFSWHSRCFALYNLAVIFLFAWFIIGFVWIWQEQKEKQDLIHTYILAICVIIWSYILVIILRFICIQCLTLLPCERSLLNANTRCIFWTCCMKRPQPQAGSRRHPSFFDEVHPSKYLQEEKWRVTS